MIEVRLASEDDYEYCRKTEFPQIKNHLLKQAIQNGWVYLVEINQLIVGYARLEFIWMTVPYLALIRIEENHQRKGAGTALTNRIFNDLKEQGHQKIYTSSEVMEPEPQEFHRKCGFIECGFIAGMNDKGIGEIFFVKNLIEN
ncbi:MAG: GNAT family N-acetyltransferase [Candidatus Thorarchaeota archaeon]